MIVFWNGTSTSIAIYYPNSIWKLVENCYLYIIEKNAKLHHDHNDNK